MTVPPHADVAASELEQLKTCAPADAHTHFARALPAFRFMPAPERRARADAFREWSARGTSAVSLKRGCAMLLQAVDRLIAEEHAAALGFVTEAREVFAACNDPDGIGVCATITSAVYRTFGNYDLALKTVWEGFEILKASGRYPAFLAASANTIANIDLELGHLSEAEAMFNVTLAESTRADDFYFLIYALHGLGRVHVHQHKPAEATDVFQRALALAELHNNPLQISNSLTELASLEFHAGNLADAETLSNRALAMREQHRLLGGAITNCVRLAEIHCARSEWNDALAILTRALAIAEGVKVKPKIAQVHQMLSHVHERMHDLELSLFHFKRYHELREQVEREDSVRKLADAKLIFDAEQARKENVVIKEQKAEIERQNVELQDTIDELTRAKIGRKAKAFTLAVAIVLFIFQDAILGTALRLLRSDNYVVLLAVKMAIIFSLAPINRAIERVLLRRVVRRKLRAATT